MAKSISEWYQRHPEARHAHRLVREAIRRGEITREPCSVCGSSKSHGHHGDYSKPLEVQWLCFRHHKEAHREERLFGAGQLCFQTLLEEARP